MLIFIFQRKDTDVVELLVNAANIDVNAKNDDGWTPLHFATSIIHRANLPKTKIVELLLNSTSIEVNLVTDTGRTPLHFASRVS